MSKFEAVKKYVLAHPDESKAQQAAGLQVDPRTVARARAALVVEGKLAADRKILRPGRLPATAGAVEPSLRDHDALKALSGLVDQAASEEDDSVTVKRLLKQCLSFAFDPTLHPDTRMSATQHWTKFKEQTKSRILGPGAPTTEKMAVSRLAELDVAVGAPIAVQALATAFDINELLVVLLQFAGPDATIAAVGRAFDVQKKEQADEGHVPPVEGEVAPGTPGVASAPGSSPDLQAPA